MTFYLSGAALVHHALLFDVSQIALAIKPVRLIISLVISSLHDTVKKNHLVSLSARAASARLTLKCRVLSLLCPPHIQLKNVNTGKI